MALEEVKVPVVGIAELGQNVSGYIARAEAGEPVIVTRHGRPIVAMLQLRGDRLEALTVAAAPRLVSEAAEALEEFRAGGGHSLDELLAETEEAAAGEASAASSER
jgi:antitoxin (DNA-binding transcriptional repressor) of toxin-antitoxin stability system